MSDWGVKIVEGLARLEERIDKRLTALEENRITDTEFKKELIEKISNWQKEMAHKINALEEKFDKGEDITMAREKDIYERLEALESEFKEAYETLNNFTKDVVALKEDICIIKSEFSRMELENNKYKEEDEWLEGK